MICSISSPTGSQQGFHCMTLWRMVSGWPAGATWRSRLSPCCLTGDTVVCQRLLVCMACSKACPDAPPRYVAMVADPSTGAISTFSGVTRNTFKGKAVVRLEYEAYEPMAVKKLKVRAPALPRGVPITNQADSMCWLSGAV